jgi:nifR3 family TIM-barrel protein
LEQRLIGMHIGSLHLNNPFILAPLAGYTDLPFRHVCRESGAALCYSEMISCHGLVYRQQNTLNMTRSSGAERPVAMQLFGEDAKKMGDAAAILSELPIDLIDLNMGCPVKKVVKKGAGAALMRDPARAAAIIRAVCLNSRQPVTVKIRSGWNHQEINAVEFALMAEEHGASAVAVHARTWSDGFSGTVDWRIIARVKAAVSIPVIGNGDVLSHADGVRMMAETNCDGVMIGRAALGAPWIFNPEAGSSPSLSYRARALDRHLMLIEDFYQATAEKILPRIKNQAGRYFKGLAGGAEIRRQIYQMKKFSQLRDFIRDQAD